MVISDNIRRLAQEAELTLAPIFRSIDEIAERNTEHILDCFRECRVSEALFTPSTGYGYGDIGRDTIDRLAALIYRAPAGFMRPQLISGTHALTVGLFGILRPGDVLLSVTGKPYDTMLEVIGLEGAPGAGSLMDFGVTFDCCGFAVENGRKVPDFAAIRAKMAEYGSRVKMVYIQRSKGYEQRPTLTVSEVRKAAYFVKKTAADLGIPEPVFFCDNCYGEFTELSEPCHVPTGAAEEAAADLIVGSLIKNPGGGMADIGGYIIGSEHCVELCGNRLTSPGVGLDAGASLGQNRNIIKGMFYAPHTVAQAMKTAHLAAYVFDALGYRVSPKWDERRSDIIQTVECGTGEGLCAFCRGIQSASPIDAHVTPEPWDMPGYTDPVIMAAGAFTGGASIELSADGPMRPPYIAFLQGGLTYESGKLGILSAAEQVSTLYEPKGACLCGNTM